MTPPDVEAIEGCLIGQAIGDAMGLPMEGLSRRRGNRLYPRTHRMQFVFGYGMPSDDTDHVAMTATAMPVPDDRPERLAEFRRRLAWRLRFWLLSLPAGIGKATLKACIKLWLGVPSTRSGVFSAGNGPAMRATILGATLRDSETVLNAFVRESTRITHTDPKAEYGALAIAYATKHAAMSRTSAPPEMGSFLEVLDRILPHDAPANELRQLLARGHHALQNGQSVDEFASALSLDQGVSGYMYHTVPVAVYAFFRHPDDYRSAVQSVIRCGGDTDTVAAIAGAIVGTRVGVSGIPQEWRDGYRDWPWTIRRLKRLAKRLSMKSGGSAENGGISKGTIHFLMVAVGVVLGFFARSVRNLFFLVIILGHIIRRMLPPY